MKKIIIAGSLIISGLVACTKQIPYKSVLKYQTYETSIINSNEEFIWAPSTGAVSRTSLQARPYWLASPKIVKLQLTESKLQAFEVEQDSSFKGNSANNKLVFEVPISYVEYRCAKDRLGECKNEEEENNDIPWNKKTKFKPDFNQLHISEVNLMPEDIERFFKNSGCLHESSTKLVDFAITDSAINFKVEKTYNVSPECQKFSALSTISDFTTTVENNYSLVKLDKLASSDYKATVYPEQQQKNLAKITTQLIKSDVDMAYRQQTATRFLNRWNPNKKEINYILSDEFKKPENASLKNATYLGFDKINNGLKQAGANFTLKLNEPNNSNPGDIRNNMIILVEDPVGGLLGYGPAIVNPRTGEILSARTVMYSGTLKTAARATYEEIRLKRQEESAISVIDPSNSIKSKTGITTNKNHNSNSMFQITSLQNTLTQFNENLASINESASNIKNSSQYFNNTNEDYSKALDYTLNKNSNSNSLDAILARHQSCFFPVENNKINTVIVQNLDKKFNTKLLPWEKLSTKDKEDVLNIIMPEIYIPTLVHEVGHNLGLRHNFAGSEDKENFYSNEELNKMGIHHIIPYSSVMDYGASELNVLPTLGKYDIAALRFAYARQVEDKNGKLVKLGNTIQDEILKLKQYKYCSDESADTNAGCRRFDEGTTYSEIADSLINRYKQRYETSNKRRSNYNFSTTSDLDYAIRIDSIFYQLRLFMEVVERIKYLGAGNDLENIWNKDETLKDIRAAAIKAGNFFMNIIAMPDYTCLIAKSSEPNKIVGAIPYKKLSSKTTSCFDASLINGYQIIGEYGKPFQSFKDPASNNMYIDQIDVRGIWIDKILATKYLFIRRLAEGEDSTSILDAKLDNFFDLIELQKPLTEFLIGFMTDQINLTVTVLDKNGVSQKIKSESMIYNTFNIPKHADPRLIKFLDLPENDSHMIEIIARALAKQNNQGEKSMLAKILQDFSSVYQTSRIFGATLGNMPNNTQMIEIKGTLYAATSNNIIAQLFIQQYKMANLALALLQKVDVKRIDELIKIKNSKANLPKNLKVLEKEFLKLDDNSYDIIMPMLTGEKSPQDVLINSERFIEMLPKVN